MGHTFVQGRPSSTLTWDTVKFVSPFASPDRYWLCFSSFWMALPACPTTPSPYCLQDDLDLQTPPPVCRRPLPLLLSSLADPKDGRLLGLGRGRTVPLDSKKMLKRRHHPLPSKITGPRSSGGKGVPRWLDVNKGRELKTLSAQ